MREAEFQLAMASLYDNPDFPSEIISSKRIKELHPLLDISSISCGLYTPCDGDVDPTLLTNAVAKQAREAGAKIRLNSHVVGIDSKPGKGFIVTLDKASGGERFETDAIVNAAGLWSRGVSAMAPLGGSKKGLHHPAFVIEHQYAVTETVDKVKELSEAGHNGGRLPVLRDLRGSSYIRQEVNILLVPFDFCI